MADWMRPLPVRACIVTYMGTGRGLRYSLSVAAGVPLTEKSPGAQLDLFTADQMQAYADACVRAALTEQPAAPVPTSFEDWWFKESTLDALEKNLTVEQECRLVWGAAIAAAIPPGHCVVPVEPSEEQVDATRQILLYYDTQGRTYEGLRHYLDCVGVKYKSWCPEWFKTETGHMTKGGTAILVYAAMLAARPGGQG